MILNIENYTVKIDFEARTVEVAQAPLNVETETLAQAVERVSQPTLNQWVPTDAEMVEMHEEMNPEPTARKPRAQLSGTRWLARKPRALETQPREVCRSTCCGTLGRRTRDGTCAGCRDLSDSDRAVRLRVNTDLRDQTEGEE